jgi:hypothetical protein
MPTIVISPFFLLRVLARVAVGCSDLENPDPLRSPDPATQAAGAAILSLLVVDDALVAAD